MRKFLFTCILAIVVVDNLNAQIEKTSKVLEPAVLECQYQCIQKLDTLGTTSVTDTMILRIGKNVSQFYACSAFYLDSLVCTPQGDEILMEQMLAAMRASKPLPAPKITKEYHYKNYPANALTTYIEFKTPRMITEKYEKQQWQLLDSTKNILGHPCKLAVCQFRGRTYKAWYATDIDSQEGPWKFNGLPGLIAEIYDTQHHYHFTLLGMNRENIRPVCFYRTDRDDIENITRIEYLKGNRERYELIKERKEKRGQNMAYDFLERDYR